MEVIAWAMCCVEVMALDRAGSGAKWVVVSCIREMNTATGNSFAGNVIGLRAAFPGEQLEGASEMWRHG